METNLLGAVIGRTALQWGGFWHLFEWLCDERESHHLGSIFADQLSDFAFNTRFGSFEIKREYKFAAHGTGTEKWPDLVIAYPGFVSPDAVIVMDDVDRRAPGGARKIENIKEYQNAAKRAFPDAAVSAVILTNGTDRNRYTKLFELLGGEGVSTKDAVSWRLLPIASTARWAGMGDNPAENNSIATLLKDYADWAEGMVCKKGCLSTGRISEPEKRS